LALVATAGLLAQAAMVRLEAILCLAPLPQLAVVLAAEQAPAEALAVLAAAAARKSQPLEAATRQALLRHKATTEALD
jgi:hypothetical protein